MKDDQTKMDSQADRKARAAVRLKREEARMQRIFDMGQAPRECGPEIITVAPARGVVEPFKPSRMVAVGNEGFQRVERGYKGRSALQVIDHLEAMNRRMARKDVEGFSERQLAAAKNYIDLAERVESHGLRGSSAFKDAPTGGGIGRDATDILIGKVEHLQRCRRAIGSSVAKEVRRIRPSKRAVVHEPIGSLMEHEIKKQPQKASITDRVLVDQVVLGGMSLTAVLHSHGWSDTGANVRALYLALRGILDRLANCF